MPEIVVPATNTASLDAPDHRQLTAPGDATAAVAVASIHAMGSGSLADFEPLYTADAVNRESATEPPDTRGTGPVAMFATARWLRTAFSDLAWDIHDVAHDDDLVVVHATMSGRQTGPFVAYQPDGDGRGGLPAARP